ncbi:MAG: ATP-binding protein [Solirubrobacterales bacterium]|nr:ATP-binding protein [Solirubrobacterales bacterium]
MATSNRDRINKMFELLAPALDEFIAGAVSTVLVGDSTWPKLVQAVDMEKGHAGERTYSSLDPQLQLRVITEQIPARLKKGWYPFTAALGRTGVGYAQELREARNEWAHNASFTDDDTMRTLDTAERLAKMVSAPVTADAIKEIRQSLRRLTSSKDDKKVLESAVVATGSEGLRPWREVLEPHDDVATGNFHAAEFAADLYKVSATDEADKDYADPVQFFSRTFLTGGLQDLIVRSVRRLTGDDNASPVVNLQTNFGGGKTHSMLALWHLASGTALGDYPQGLQELLGESEFSELGEVRRVALVGNHLSTSGVVKDDGTQVNTIWGELAWQLGGKEGFEIVAKSDSDRTPPGKALHDLLEKFSPALILIDEWVAYARTLVDRDDLAAGTFDDQFTFAQSLTEAVKGTSGVMLAISIPASESSDDSEVAVGNAEEVGGRNGLEALKRLQNVVRRVADQWRPASSDEAFHIVRQRLFKTADAAGLAAIEQTAREFVAYYTKHADEFPRETRGGSYEEKIIQTYPIHPELFERLYEDWSTLERFQRTRGVLRLMSTVIHALWRGNDQSPLIMPGSLPIADKDVNAEVTQYLQDNWKSVVDADVDGDNSEPAKIDKEKPLFGQRAVTRRLARTVFLGSAPTTGAAHKGLESSRVFLGTAMPGDNPGNFHSALTQLHDRGTYFYASGGRYWYDLQANISRRAKDMAERLQAADVYAEIASRLGGQSGEKGSFAFVHVCPEDASDIPDSDEARLVILHPKYTHKGKETSGAALDFARIAIEQRGTTPRRFRNMLVFLAPDRDRAGDLEAAVREYLSWEQILKDAAELDLTESQKIQADDRREKASKKVGLQLRDAYQWALIPHGQPIEIGVTRIDGQSDWLADRVSRKLGNEGELTVQHNAQLIRMRLNNEAAKLWEDGSISVGDLWRLYAEYPYMPRLRNREVLNDGLNSPQMLWEQDGFALADGFDSESERFVGLVLPDDGVQVQITDSTLIVRPEIALAQRAAELPGDGGPVAVPGPEGPGEPGGADGPGTVPSEPAVTRFTGSKKLTFGKMSGDINKVVEEVLNPLSEVDGVEFEITLEIEARSPNGFDEAKVRTVSENASTLKFNFKQFGE